MWSRWKRKNHQQNESDARRRNVLVFYAVRYVKVLLMHFVIKDGFYVRK